MTTRHSPLRELKAQADKIAATIAAAERGEVVDVEFAQKIAVARSRESFKIGIVMDDKVITIDLPWETIRASGEVGLSEYILRQMRESRDTVQ
jgi:hypothetical protein